MPPCCTGQMSASAQCTPGDPVLLPAESKQLAYNSLIDQSQFLVQDKLYLHTGIDPQKSYTLASVLAGDTTPGMQRVFWGTSRSIVIVGPEADKDHMFPVADCVARLHTTLVQLSIVILSPPRVWMMRILFCRRLNYTRGSRSRSIRSAFGEQTGLSAALSWPVSGCRGSLSVRRRPG